jgi:hypothetical protein
MRAILIPATIALAITAVASSSIPASAAGCLKGAVIGGVAGHYAGHHGLLDKERPLRGWQLYGLAAVPLRL